MGSLLVTAAQQHTFLLYESVYHEALHGSRSVGKVALTTVVLHGQAAIEEAAFKQQEHEEKAARHSRESQKRPFEAAVSPAKRANFRPTSMAPSAQDTSAIPCRDFAAGRCNRGNSCRFGHFLVQTGGNAQRTPAPAASYTATAHSHQAAPQQ